MYYNAVSRPEKALESQPGISVVKCIPSEQIELFKELFEGALTIGRPCKDILIAMVTSPLASTHLKSIISALKSTRLSPFIHELYKNLAQNAAIKPRVRGF